MMCSQGILIHLYLCDMGRAGKMRAENIFLKRRHDAAWPGGRRLLCSGTPLF